MLLRQDAAIMCDGPFRSETGITEADHILVAAAEGASEAAYAPYSGFAVGAVVTTERGGRYLGCNVENVSFPVGTCAERNAIAAAVLAEGSKVRIARVVLTARQGGRPVPCSPCGACRQAIAEFSGDAEVIFRDPTLRFVRYRIGELLPAAFNWERQGVGR